MERTNDSGRVLVVGAGISGATIANLISASSERNVLVIDRRDSIGGNCFDHKDKNGITVHKYGSHIMNTSDRNVWSFLKQFTDFNDYEHKVVASIDGKETYLPFNLNSLYDLFPEQTAKTMEAKLLSKYQQGDNIPILDMLLQGDEDIRSLAEYVYDKLFLNYTVKHWGLSPKEIDYSVTARVPVRISKDDRYFQETYQGIPSEGYSKMISRMLEMPNISVKLRTEFKDAVDTEQYDHIFYTGSIDELMDYRYGPLPYRSLRFELETHDKEYYQSNSVFNFPNEHKYTRIHEYKYYLNETSDKTTIAKEYPEPFERGRNERFYPIPRKENQNLYRRYLKDAFKTYGNIHFLGRLGDYKYYDMDKAVLRAMQVFDEVFG
ncbi:MAG: UDP-galactopyranose mutase [Methanomassiliicoccaceae archaeon]|nr:UDP-galactopyranose mutase [Methanomassiliicoccaceae archaeon]